MEEERKNLGCGLGGFKGEENDKEEAVGVVTLGVCSADERLGSKSKGDG
jgi:hypothetical protein